MPEVIKLKPLTSWEKAQRKRATLPAPLRMLTSLKTTAVLGATLGALLSPATATKTISGVGRLIMPKTLKGAVGMAIGVPTAYGVLKSSAKARTFAKKAIDPREAIKRGEYVGGMIEEPKKFKKKAEKEGWWEGVKEAGKKGGKYGLIGAGVLGAGAVAKKYLEKRKERKAGLLTTDTKREAVAPQLMPPLQRLGSGVGLAPQVSPIQPSGATKTTPPIQNIIQIQFT